MINEEFLQLNRKMYAGYLAKERNLDKHLEESFKQNKPFSHRKDLLRESKVAREMMDWIKELVDRYK